MNKYLVAAAVEDNPIEIHSLTANSIHEAEQKIINYFVQFLYLVKFNFYV